MALQRYKLTVAYRGTNYHGWQKQLPNSLYKGPAPAEGQGIPTIQETLLRVIGEVVHQPIQLVGSSRTDAGVHAKGQVAHFDADAGHIPPEGMRRAINARLPGDIVVRSIEPVETEFDARRSTKSKRYQYFIWNSPDRPPFFGDLVWHRWQDFDIAAMRAAAERIVGTHDFAAFAKTGHGRESTVRTVMSCEVSYRPPRLVVGVEGSGFLWNMVRIIVGTLADVGLGRRSIEQVQTALDSADRRLGGPTAPARGLYLQWIRY